MKPELCQTISRQPFICGKLIDSTFPWTSLDCFVSDFFKWTILNKFEIFSDRKLFYYNQYLSEDTPRHNSVSGRCNIIYCSCQIQCTLMRSFREYLKGFLAEWSELHRIKVNWITMVVWLMLIIPSDIYIILCTNIWMTYIICVDILASRATTNLINASAVVRVSYVLYYD